MNWLGNDVQCNIELGWWRELDLDGGTTEEREAKMRFVEMQNDDAIGDTASLSNHPFIMFERNALKMWRISEDVRKSRRGTLNRSVNQFVYTGSLYLVGYPDVMYMELACD